MATMTDVARLAGVSVSTVSHVVNGTRNVEPETRERVESALLATGYKKDALARALKRSRTDSVGLVVSDPAEPAFAEMVRGVEAAATEAGLTLLLASSGEDPDHERRAVDVLLERRVDGLILARCAHSPDSVLTGHDRTRTPVVLMDRLYDLDLDQVGVRNAEAMARLVAHLVGHGHSRIGLVAGDLAVPTLRERRAGFLRAAQDAGLAADLVVVGDTGAADAHASTLRLLAQQQPSALIASSTVLAAGALRAVQERGLRLPDDVALAVFDGFAYADLFEPRLTTVRQPAFEVGRQALRLLVDRMAQPDGPAVVLRLDPVIEYRASTGDPG